MRYEVCQIFPAIPASLNRETQGTFIKRETNSEHSFSHNEGSPNFTCQALFPKYTPVICPFDTDHSEIHHFDFVLPFSFFQIYFGQRQKITNVAELPQPDFLPTLLNSVNNYASAVPKVTEPDFPAAKVWKRKPEKYVPIEFSFPLILVLF